MPGFGGAVKLTGESEYRKALQLITQRMKEVSSEMKVVASAYDKNDNSVKALTAKQEVLNKKLDEQKNKLNTLKSQYSSMSSQYAQSTSNHEKLVNSYNKEKAELDKIGSTLGTTSKEYQDQKSKVENLAQAVAKSSENQDANAKSMSNMRIQLNNAQADVNKTTKEIEELGNTTEDTEKKVEKAGDGFTVFKGILANLATQAITTAINGLKKLGQGVVDVGKQAIASYADYEQLVGGVETLFGAKGAKTVEEYAQIVGKSVNEVRGEFDTLMEKQTTVMTNANNAYKTAGLSANEYMNTVNSFAASLTDSLGEYSWQAANYADMAVTDMADNANKMRNIYGSSTERISADLLKVISQC